MYHFCRYRDPNVSVPLKEITRFPHAVLEIKLQLLGEDQTPPWVTELLESGMLLEVHKFSKFIHGCAVLLTDDVREVPYWIDDATLSQSITQSGAESLIASENETKGASNTTGKDYFESLLPHDKHGQPKSKVQPIKHECTNMFVFIRMNGLIIPNYILFIFLTLIQRFVRLIWSIAAARAKTARRTKRNAS